MCVGPSPLALGADPARLRSDRSSGCRFEDHSAVRAVAPDERPQERRVTGHDLHKCPTSNKPAPRKSSSASPGAGLALRRRCGWRAFQARGNRTLGHPRPLQTAGGHDCGAGAAVEGRPRPSTKARRVHTRQGPGRGSANAAPAGAAPCARSDGSGSLRNTTRTWCSVYGRGRNLAACAGAC